MSFKKMGLAVQNSAERTFMVQVRFNQKFYWCKCKKSGSKMEVTEILGEIAKVLVGPGRITEAKKIAASMPGAYAEHTSRNGCAVIRPIEFLEANNLRNSMNNTGGV